MVARLWPDSARTKNTAANMIASQRIPRAAINLFMVLLLLPRVSIPDLSTERS
jgi:hypothetical protein